MAAEIVNLRRARKSRDRAEAGKRADENRARHGRTKLEKHAERDEAERTRRTLDNHRLEREDPPAG